MARRNRKKNREINPDVQISTLDDIRYSVESFMINSTEIVEINTELDWTDEDGKKRHDEIKVESRDITLRRLLLEGFDLVKTRMAIAEKAKADTDDDDDELLPERIKWELFDIDAQYFHVDALIRRHLGGKRRGLRVRWDIPAGSYEFDPYEGKLFRVDE